MGIMGETLSVKARVSVELVVEVDERWDGDTQLSYILKQAGDSACISVQGSLKTNSKIKHMTLKTVDVTITNER